MRLQQVQNLTEDELGLLLYIVNVVFPVQHLSFEITPNWLPSIRHDLLLQRVFRSQSLITDEGKPILKSLWDKLNKRWDYEVTYDDGNSANTESSGSNIQVEPSGIHLETANTGSTNTTGSAGSEQQGSGSCPTEQNGKG